MEYNNNSRNSGSINHIDAKPAYISEPDQFELQSNHSESDGHFFEHRVSPSFRFQGVLNQNYKHSEQFEGSR